MGYTESGGFSQQTREELVFKSKLGYEQFLESQTGQSYDISEDQFVATLNWIWVSFNLIPMVEETERATAEFVEKVFAEMDKRQIKIDEGIGGGSYIGIQKAVKPFSRGLQIRNHYNDPSIPPDKIHGSVFYFDNFVEDPKTGLTEEILEMLKTITPFNSNPTPTETLPELNLPDTFKTIRVPLDNGEVVAFHYYNLLPANYKTIYIKVLYSVEEDGDTYAGKEAEIETYIRKRFEEMNYIGRSFYEDQYTNGEEFPWISKISIQTSEDRITYEPSPKLVDFGEKLILSSDTFVFSKVFSTEYLGKEEKSEEEASLSNIEIKKKRFLGRWRDFLEKAKHK